MKKIFTLIAALFVGMAANAADAPLTLDNFGTSGWGSSWDSTTKTITYESEWKGRGWWLDNVDLSAYDEITIGFEKSSMTVQLVAEYNNAENESTSVEAGATSITYKLNADAKNSVKQIYLQTNAAGTLTLTSVTLTDAYKTNNVVLADFETDATSKCSVSWSGTGSIVESDGGHVFNVAEAAWCPLMIDLSGVSESDLRNAASVTFRVSATANTGSTDNLKWNQLALGLTDDQYTETASDYQIGVTIWKTGAPELNTWTNVEGVVGDKFTSFLDAGKTPKYLMIKWGKNNSSFQIDDVVLQVKETSGIKSLSLNETAGNVSKTEYYNISGQKLNAPQKGINIIKMTLDNGTKTSKKVIVR